MIPPRRRALRASLALALVAAHTAGCAPTLVLHPRPGSVSGDPEGAGRARRVGVLLDEAQALGQWYAHEAAKAHHKRRVMAGLGAAMSLTAAGLGVAAFADGTDREVDGALMSFGVTVGVFGALLEVLPFAHGYAEKERCYGEARGVAEAAYARLADRCQPALGAGGAGEVMAACEGDLLASNEALRHFPAGSPCGPPPPEELDRALRRARRWGEAAAGTQAAAAVPEP